MLLRHLILCIQMSIVLSIPSCKFTGEHGTTFTCRAGSSDYFLRRGLVSDQNRTKIIVLKNCRITDIDFESFDGLPAVHTIDISSNKIKELKLGVLDESRHVRRLNISYNAIELIPLGLFDQMPDLEMLDARGNKFNNFELGVFAPIKKLNHLDLSNNVLNSKEMSEWLFDENKKMGFLDFSRNDMSNAHENLLSTMEVLDLLNLDSCSLSQVPEFIMASNLGTLRHILLSTNTIRSLNNPNVFRYLIRLQILDLTGNQIVTLHENVFKELRKLTVLMLRYNKIQGLPETIFQNLGSLASLDLSHNEIKFVSENTFKNLPRLKRLNLSINRLTYLPFQFYNSLLSSGTVLAKFYFNQNPWQCACLKEILHEAKLNHIVYNDNKYNGNYPVCADPEDGKFLCKRNPKDSEITCNLFDELNKEVPKSSVEVR